MQSTFLWYLSRATGTATLVLLTLVVVLGVLTAGRRRPHGETTTIVTASHRWLSLGMLAFVTVHVLTVVLDSYVSVPLTAVLVPFTSAYSRLWVGLGTVALDLMLAVVLTSVMRHRIRETLWRKVHWVTYGLWPVAALHAYGLGTASQPLLRWVTVACAAGCAAAVAWRLNAGHADGERRRALAQESWR